MTFLQGLTPLTFSVRAIKMLLGTGLNVLLINYATRRAIENGDTEWLSTIILLICMVCTAALFIDAISKCRKQFIWTNALYLAFCGFNLYYFFSMLACCVPGIGNTL